MARKRALSASELVQEEVLLGSFFIELGDLLHRLEEAAQDGDAL